MRILLFCAALLLSFPVSAAQVSGSYLIQVCAKDEKGKEVTKGGHAVCQSYIAGVIDYHNLVRSLGTAPSVDFCVPEGAGLTQLQDVVLRYLLKHHSEHESFNASPAIALALFEAYPCKS